MKKFIVVLFYVFAMLSFEHIASAYPILIEETYEVQDGDTLDSITDLYISKNTYGAREHREFKSGIVQLNEWLLWEDLYIGAKLRINYWINDKENESKCRR